MPEFPMDPARIAEEIGIPVEIWPGNCHGVAEAILRDMPVRGMRLTRGHYTGFVSSKSVYGKGPSQHTWLTLEDGRVLDPTRWAMERPDTPSVYLGISDSYDEGGMALRARTRAQLRANAIFLSGPTAEGVILKALGASPHARELVLATGGGLSEIASARNADKVAQAIESPVEQLKNPERVYRAVVAAGLGALLQIDQRIRVLEPEKVTPDRQRNFFYEIPPVAAESDMAKLFRVFTRFLSVEHMDMRLESAAEEFGYTLDEFHEGLNRMERRLQHDPDLEHFSGRDASMISMIAADHLGSGFGAEMEVESYARSVGLGRRALHDALVAFGGKAGYDLIWLTADEIKEMDAGPEPI